MKYEMEVFELAKVPPPWHCKEVLAFALNQGGWYRAKRIDLLVGGTFTHWAYLPPDPPKPKRWEKREVFPTIITSGQNCRVDQTFIPLNSRNLKLTYEVEVDQ